MAMTKGYDVSHHQGVFDHAAAKEEGFSFCIVKATEGATFVDSTFERNWRELGDLGIVRGAYHFGRPGSNSARVEAHHYLKTADPGADDIRPVLDLEDFGAEQLGPSALEDWVEEWVQEVGDETGKRPIIYTRRFWMDNLAHLAGNFETDLWVPRYSDAMLDPELPRSWDNFLIWQWAGTSGDEFFPHQVGPVKDKFGPEARLIVAGRKVDQNVLGDGVTIDDLIGKRAAQKLERWVMSAVFTEDGKRQVENLFDPVELEALGNAVGKNLQDIARRRKRGQRIVVDRRMV